MTPRPSRAALSLLFVLVLGGCATGTAFTPPRETGTRCGGEAPPGSPDAGLVRSFILFCIESP
ncbi:MAG: hypothetical protein HY727_14395 [Candidatus Rokubacteria bacterium]|nr:hypothetical protein [Candidatus Rokubacteria bacterium]